MATVTTSTPGTSYLLTHATPTSSNISTSLQSTLDALVLPVFTFPAIPELPLPGLLAQLQHQSSTLDAEISDLRTKVMTFEVYRNLGSVLREFSYSSKSTSTQKPPTCSPITDLSRLLDSLPPQLTHLAPLIQSHIDTIFASLLSSAHSGTNPDLYKIGILALSHPDSGPVIAYLRSVPILPLSQFFARVCQSIPHNAVQDFLLKPENKRVVCSPSAGVDSFLRNFEDIIRFSSDHIPASDISKSEPPLLQAMNSSAASFFTLSISPDVKAFISSTSLASEFTSPQLSSPRPSISSPKLSSKSLPATPQDTAQLLYKLSRLVIVPALADRVIKTSVAVCLHFKRNLTERDSLELSDLLKSSSPSFIPENVKKCCLSVLISQT